MALFVGVLAFFEQGLAQADGPQLRVETSEAYGEYVADSKGRALYLFTDDERETSACYDTCAEAWPPVMVENMNKI